MLIVISYDVATDDPAGKKRLRHVAKCCLRYGQRVQYSVFECQIDYAQYLQLKNDLLKEIDLTQDSIRIYSLGNKYETKTEHYGVKERPDLATDTLVM